MVRGRLHPPPDILTTNLSCWSFTRKAPDFRGFVTCARENAGRDSLIRRSGRVLRPAGTPERMRSMTFPPHLGFPMLCASSRAEARPRVTTPVSAHGFVNLVKVDPIFAVFMNSLCIPCVHGDTRHGHKTYLARSRRVGSYRAELLTKFSGGLKACH